MTHHRFHLTPDVSKHREGHPEDIPIDSMNISKMIQAAGIDCPVRVNHITGECEILDVDKLSTSQKKTLENLMKGMPQFVSDGGEK